jgi:phosphoglucosamine mutase
MARLFGTDGVRGVANRELTPELVLSLGQALGRRLHAGETRPSCVVGRDSRLSGDLLEAALTAGLCSAGVDVWSVGILPTPAVSFLTRAFGASAGAVISASHNPVADNGVKFFDHRGEKLADAEEDAVEAMLGQPFERPVGPAVGRRQDRAAEARERYVKHLKGFAKGRLAGRVVVDAAFGAAAAVARDVWADLADDVLVINGSPDGVRINVGCGSTHPETLAAAVTATGARLGVAFDGDADRVIAVDETGAVVDGDRLLYLFARHLLAKGRLVPPKVAVTVLSNMGLVEALADIGVGVVETKVGDRYVLEAMRREGLVLGGEKSGHIVIGDVANTGDGLLASLLLHEVLVEEGRPLSELARAVRAYPQRTADLPVADKAAFLERPEVAALVAEAKASLHGRGRVLVRPSGTEPLIRVMVEAADESVCDEVLGALVRGLEAVATPMRKG